MLSQPFQQSHFVTKAIAKAMYIISSGKTLIPHAAIMSVKIFSTVKDVQP